MPRQDSGVRRTFSASIALLQGTVFFDQVVLPDASSPAHLLRLLETTSSLHAGELARISLEAALSVVPAVSRQPRAKTTDGPF